MRSVSALLLLALSAVAVKATNVTGDPTNLANWPPCAVCIIHSFISNSERKRQLKHITSSKTAFPSVSDLQSLAIVSRI